MARVGGERFNIESARAAKNLCNDRLVIGVGLNSEQAATARADDERAVENRDAGDWQRRAATGISREQSGVRRRDRADGKAAIAVSPAIKYLALLAGHKSAPAAGSKDRGDGL